MQSHFPALDHQLVVPYPAVLGRTIPHQSKRDSCIYAGYSGDAAPLPEGFVICLPQSGVIIRPQALFALQPNRAKRDWYQ